MKITFADMRKGEKMGRLLDEDDVIDWLLKRTEMYDATGHFVDENVVKKNIESQIAKIPSAQPDTDEWCYDCKEYDPSRHCCPRFNRVIRETLKEAQPTIEERKTGKWIYKKDLKQFFCDQCGEPSLTEDDCYIYGMDLSNFCPNCGSQMMRGDSNDRQM